MVGRLTSVILHLFPQSHLSALATRKMYFSTNSELSSSGLLLYFLLFVFILISCAVFLYCYLCTYFLFVFVILDQRDAVRDIKPVPSTEYIHTLIPSCVVCFRFCILILYFACSVCEPHIPLLLTFLMLLIFHANWFYYCLLTCVHNILSRNQRLASSQIQVLDDLAHLSTCIIESKR